MNMRNLLLVIVLLFSFQGFTQDKIKISTWNVKMLPKVCNSISKKNKLWQEIRLNQIIDFLKNSSSDIIQLQEVFDKAAVVKIEQQLNYKYPYIIIPQNQFLKFSNGLMILSKISIKKEKTIFFRNHKLHDALVSKGATLYSFEHNFQKMYVVNTHLQSDYKLATSEILRGQQLNQIIEEIIEPISNQYTPILLAGDYNFDIHSNEYNRFVSITGVKETCFNDKNRNYTFDNKNYWNKDTKSEQLDHIFVLDRNNVLDCSKLSLIAPKMNDLVDYSDHYGLEISLSFSKKIYVLEK
jgi:endonuclease/exonuclease/phosphatase family metal-dependent hydrolase